MRRTDLVMASTGEYLPAERFAQLRPYLRLPDGIHGFFKALLGIGVAVGVAYCLGTALEPSRPEKVRRRVNDEPVERWKKKYVSIRDNWHCTYCGRRVTRSTRHVDHSVSRVNGGTNHLNNLRLACLRCNLSKGELSARQFSI